MSSESPLPRAPSAFSPSTHFAQRFRGPGADGFDRHLDGEIVRRCIEDGDLRKVNRDKWRFEADIAGVEYALVVRQSTQDVITGHPIALDHERAAASSRWSSEQLTEIQTFLDER